MHTELFEGAKLTLLTREDWGADPLIPDDELAEPLAESQFVRLVSHHTAIRVERSLTEPWLVTCAAHMRRLQSVRPDLGLEVPYSFVIFAGERSHDAVIGVGRGPGRKGRHTSGHNDTAYGVAWAANTETEKVTAGMVAAFRWVGSRYLVNALGAGRTIGHSDVSATLCPGAYGKDVLSRLQPPFTTPEPQPIGPPVIRLVVEMPDGSEYRSGPLGGIERT